MYNRQTGSSGPGMQPAGNTGNTKPSADFSPYGGGYGKFIYFYLILTTLINAIIICIIIIS